MLLYHVLDWMVAVREDQKPGREDDQNAGRHSHQQTPSSSRISTGRPEPTPRLACTTWSAAGTAACSSRSPLLVRTFVRDVVRVTLSLPAMVPTAARRCA